jgi:L-malate glycosyltransferase
MKRIIAVHLENDRSGNALVFRQSLEALADKCMEVHLITNKSQAEVPGFLNGIAGVHYHFINYIERGNTWRKLFSFLLAQLLIFRKVVQLYEPEAKVYINTLLPLGAAWAGRLKQAPITYHLHDTPGGFLHKQLLRTAQRYATNVVFASRFIQGQYHFPKAVKHVIHSCLPSSFIQEATIHAHIGHRRTVLMVAKAADESGLPELIELAQSMPRTKFEVVINSTKKKVQRYISHYNVPDNVMIYDMQTNLHPFYQRAAVVLNLSHTSEKSDEFDISILQALSYGRPVIVPLAGCSNELVAHGWNGYRISGHYIQQVRQHVEQLMNNKALYADMSCAAQLVASQFKPQLFREQVEDIFLEGNCFTAKRQEEPPTVLLYPAALQEYINTALN